MNKEQKIKIKHAKGRKTFNWVGKKPFYCAKCFPTQLVELFDPLNTGRIVETNTYDELNYNWQNVLFHVDNGENEASIHEVVDPQKMEYKNEPE